MFNDRKETRRGVYQQRPKREILGGGGEILVPKQKGLT